ncbi:DNA replication and repair protein RecF [Candidatus Gottesmanbacteria bacterium]|nr:DNA replication and repair protein RecF [Candidatus Gottesmanbacteria bacterium]
MILTSIGLQNFRSYQKQTFQFSPYVTLIIGPNTVGKTNILEGIVFLATGKSFRADSDREMIRWNEDLARVCAVVNETKLEALVTGGVIGGQAAPMKKYLVNGVPRRLVDFLGNLRTVLFWPEHLELVTDSPSLRRRYLDSVLIQVDWEYRRNLLSYERGLRQRNSLLERIKEGFAHRGQLLFWDQLLIRAGGYITDKRSAFIDFINNSYKDYKDYKSYRIQYDKSVISESRLLQYKEEEIAAKATLVGPHRDDFTITKYNDYKNYNDYNGYRNLAKFGSRGEQRLAVLWLKLAELAFIQGQVGERPILLLDDILSELDRGHRKLVFDLIAKQQTVITSADEESVRMLGGSDRVIIHLSR